MRADWLIIPLFGATGAKQQISLRGGPDVVYQLSKDVLTTVLG
jgi:hypothetical protein